MSRRAAFDWARSAVREAGGERLRSIAFDRSLAGAAYPLAETICQRESGLRPEGGLTLVL